MKTVGDKEPRALPPCRDGADWIAWARKCRFDEAALAALFRVSIPQLQSFFSAVFFVPPDYWLAHVRIWDAARLVCAGISPERITERLAFPSPSLLKKEFRKYHGCSPDEFVRLHSRWTAASEVESEFARDFRSIPWMVAFENLCAPVARATALRDCPVPGLDLLTLCLHERLRLGCPETGDVLAGLLFEPLIAQLSIDFSELARPTIADAAKEALAVSVAEPARFNPARCTLPDFLRKEARNHLRKLRRLQTDAGKSEAKLIEQAQNGDEQAFTELACAAKPALRKEALRLIQGKFRLEEVSGDDGGMAAAALSIPSLSGREHDLREFWAAIEQCLKPRDFRLLRLHTEEGMKFREIAKCEGLPVGTVKSLISDAKKKLRAEKKIQPFRTDRALSG